MTEIRDVATSGGPARIFVDRSRHPVAVLVLCHGAGKGVDARDLVALAQALPRQGVSVYRIEQPWVVAGKKVAPRPAVLDQVTDEALSRLRLRAPLVLGGRSAGARTACRLALRQGAIGCLALAFPLHPPGRPEQTRLAELVGAGVPTLVVQGERDSFGRPDEFPASVELAVVPSGDHGFAVLKRAPIDQDQALAVVVEAVVEWVTARVG
jgi:predicted alpha/beta-hydrolase family hydrolase